MPDLQKPPDLDESGQPVLDKPPDLDANGKPDTGGHFETRGWTQQWIPNVKPPSERPDQNMAGGWDKLFEDRRANIVKNTANDKTLPEWAKPYYAEYMTTGNEALRTLAEAASDPLQFAGGIAGSFFKMGESGASRAIKPTEVLPPEQPRIRGLLEAPRDPYITGPGGSQLRSKLTPQEEARVAGYNVDGPTTAPPDKPYTGSVTVDKPYPPMMPINRADQGILAYALRKSENPEQILYPREEATGFAKYAERDRQIKDDIAAPEIRARQRFERFMTPSGNPEIPASPYSERMAFNPFTRPDVDQGYPLNVVPSALQPRTIQSQMEALAPEYLKVPPHIAEQEIPKIITVNRPVGPPTEYSAGPLAEGGVGSVERKYTDQPPDLNRGGTAAIRPGEDILPTAPKVIERPYEDKLDNYVTKNITPVEPDAASEVAPITMQSRTTMKRLSDALVTSMEQRLSKQGPVGMQMRNLFSNVEFTKRELFNKYASPYIEATNLLTTAEEKANFVEVMNDSKVPPISPNVAKAVEMTRPITDEMGQIAKDTGVKVKMPNGTVRGFEPLKDYWPKRPVTPVNRPAFIQELMEKNDLSYPQAKRISENLMNHSEFFNSSQHARWPGKFDYEWRKDLNAMTEHIADMSDIIARAKHLGPGDIGDPNSIISKLAKAAPDPMQAQSMATSILRGGMDKNNDFNQAVKTVNRLAARSQVFTKLSMFPISNLNNQLQSALQSTSMDFIKGLGEMVVSSPEIRAVAKEYGTSSIGKIPTAILGEAGKKPVPVIGNLISASEDFNRVVATGIGRGTAQTVFDNAKAGNRLSIRKLQDLLLESDITPILKQEKLTPDQLKFATNRFVEMTQQLGSNMKLPQAWVDEPLLSTPLIFKRFSFQATKSIKDAMLQDPLHTIPKFLIMAPMFGELTGDAKAAIYGVVRGTIDPSNGIFASVRHELSTRGNYAGRITQQDAHESDEAWLADRLAADYLQSWGLGLFADMLQGALGGTEGGYSAVFGPFWNDIISTIGTAGKGNWTELARQNIRRIPLIGPGAQRALLPTKSQEVQY